MEKGQVNTDIAALPIEAQKQVGDFIAFLRQRYGKPQRPKSIKKNELAREPFIGMWSDREVMQDSTEWMREHRRREWTR